MGYEGAREEALGSSAHCRKEQNRVRGISFHTKPLSADSILLPFPTAINTCTLVGLRAEGSSSALLKRRMSSTSGVRGECGPELHVLAVDDSSVDRMLIERLLRSSSYKVTTVDSGKRALELLGLAKDGRGSSKVPKVNMIITDYCMPEMTGYDLLKRVKGSSALREIPVVVVSSENIPNRIHRCLEEGAEEFLLKPLQPSDVYRLCSRVVQRGRF